MALHAMNAITSKGVKGARVLGKGNPTHITDRIIAMARNSIALGFLSFWR